MTTPNNKKNRPPETAKVPMKPITDVTKPIYTAAEMEAINTAPAVKIAEVLTPNAVVFEKAKEPTIETVQVADGSAHPMQEAVDAFVAAAADYVDLVQSAKSTVVGPYRIAFNGPQMVSVTHV